MSTRPPILFIHGAHCDARIWLRGFLQSFEQRGWRCRAVDLPGHGGQPPRGGRIDELGLDDYVAAIGAAVAGCDLPPVLVGHSMGGYLAQSFALAGGAASALVLLASPPPHGMGRDALMFALRHPLLAASLGLSSRASPGHGERRVRALLMTPATPADTVAWVQGLLQRESARAMRELGLRALPARRLPMPVLAVAGAHDRLISLASQRALARAYQAPLQVQATMAHMLSLEPGWQQVADQVAGFLDHALAPPA